MDCWFTTSHGYTKHNNPATEDYVRDEPPVFPRIKIDYHDECIKKGFARAGWPNTGNLLPDHFGEGRLALGGYSFDTLDPPEKTMLRNFATIRAGDLIIIPATSDDVSSYGFHLGIVLNTDKQFIHPSVGTRPLAYYYYYNIPAGDVYECSHRVNVRWAMDNDGEASEFHINGLTGIWRKPGSRVIAQAGKLSELGRKAKLF